MSEVRTHNCEPTLSDSEVMEFCRQGYFVLEAVVSEEINKRTCEFLLQNERTEQLLEEDWFVDNVILNPQAAGAVRSLLGSNFKLTMPFIFNHLAQEPMEPQAWHRDGSSHYGPELDSLQVFYYPQDTPVDLGPTEVLPGSHFLFGGFSHMDHYRNFKGVVSTAAPAGSIFLTVYSVWHRRARSTSAGRRNLLKYWYTRTVAPQRDWVTEPGLELAHAYHRTDFNIDHRETHRAMDDSAEMFYWLCGEHEKCRAWSNNLPVYYYESSESCSQCGHEVAGRKVRG